MPHDNNRHVSFLTRLICGFLLFVLFFRISDLRRTTIRENTVNLAEDKHDDVCKNTQPLQNYLTSTTAFTDDPDIKKHLPAKKTDDIQQLTKNQRGILETCNNNKVQQKFSKYHHSLQLSDSISEDLANAYLLDKEWSKSPYTSTITKYRFVIFAEIMKKWHKDILTDDLITNNLSLIEFTMLQKAANNATFIFNEIVARDEGYLIANYVDDYNSIFWKIKLYSYKLWSRNWNLYAHIDELESDIKNLDTHLFMSPLNKETTGYLKSVKNELKRMYDQFWKNVYFWSTVTLGGVSLGLIIFSWICCRKKSLIAPTAYRIKTPLSGENNRKHNNNRKRRERRGRKRKTRKNDETKCAKIPENKSKKPTDKKNDDSAKKQPSEQDLKKINGFISKVKREFKLCKATVNISGKPLGNNRYLFCFQRKNNVSEKKFAYFSDDLDKIKGYIRRHYSSGVQFIDDSNFSLKCHVVIITPTKENVSKDKQSNNAQPKNEQPEDINNEEVRNQTKNTNNQNMNNQDNHPTKKEKMVAMGNGNPKKLINGNKDDLDEQPRPKGNTYIPIQLIGSNKSPLTVLKKKINRGGGKNAFKNNKNCFFPNKSTQPHKNMKIFNLGYFPEITDEVDKYFVAWNFMQLCNSLIPKFTKGGNNQNILLEHRNNLVHEYYAVDFLRLRSVAKELIDLQDGKKQVLSPHQNILKDDIKKFKVNVYEQLNRSIDKLYTDNNFELDADNLQQVKKAIIETQYSIELQGITSISNLQQTIIRLTKQALQNTDAYVNCVKSFDLDFDATIKKCCQIDKEYMPKAEGMPTLDDLINDLVVYYDRLQLNQTDRYTEAASMVLSLIPVVIRDNVTLFNNYKFTNWYQQCNKIRHEAWRWNNLEELAPIVEPILETFLKSTINLELK